MASVNPLCELDHRHRRLLRARRDRPRRRAPKSRNELPPLHP
jgi:hypothetical protein